MRNNDENDLTSILRNLIEAYYHYVTGVLRLAKLETKLAVNSAILLAILFFILIALAFSFWASILVVAYCYLITLHFSSLSAASIVSASNLFLIVVVVFIMNRARKNLYFTATRKQLVAALTDEDDEDEPVKISNQTN